ALEILRVVEDLHDVELAAVVESPPHDARVVDARLVASRRVLHEQAVDEEGAAAGPERAGDRLPERVEPGGRNVRQPEGEEHEADPPGRRPREDVRDDVLDAIRSDARAIDLDRLR